MSTAINIISYNLISLVTHLIGSINLYNLCLFFRGCVPEVLVSPYAVSFTYIPGKLWFAPSLLCSLMMRANNRVHYGGLILSFAHYCIIIIIIMQTYLKISNSQVALWVQCRLCVPDEVNSFNYLSCNIWSCVYSAYPLLLRWLWEYMYYIS